MQTLIKQPAETLKRQLAFPAAAVVAAIVSVAVEARGLVVGADPLTVSGEIVAGLLIVEMAGGSDGERYIITGRADTAAGETLEAEMEVAVLDAAWVMPDGGAPWLTIAEFVDMVGLEETVRMTDGDGSGRIDRALLVAALTAGQTTAELYVAARYQLPLDPAPNALKQIVADLARGRLYPRGAPEGVETAVKAAQRTLEQISQGKLPLPSSSPIASAPSEAPIVVSPGRRQYPDGLGDY